MKEKQIKSLDNMIELFAIEKENPYKEFDNDKLHNFLESIGNEAEEAFNSTLKELIDCIKPFEICNLTSWFSFYYLNMPEGDQINSSKNILSQFHIELLQALAIKNSVEEVEWKPVLPPDAERITELTKKVCESFSLLRMKNIDVENIQEKRRIALIEQMRSNTMAIRNWGYPDQVIRISSELFETMDDEINEEFGVSIVALINMCKNIILQIESKMNIHFNKMRAIISSKSTEEVVDRYMESFPFIKSTREEMLQLGKRFSSVNHFAEALIMHADLHLRDVYLIKIEEFVDAYPKKIELDVLKKVIENWALTPGDLNNFPYEHIFLGNPIWDKPLLKVDSNSYFWPIPGLFFHSIFNMMEGIFSSNQRLQKRYENIRGKYLEWAVEKIFKDSFPQAKIFKNIYWRDPEDNREYENDLLVIMDSFAVIVECKAGKITNVARRGAVKTLEREIKKLLVEPSIQGSRFSRYLKFKKDDFELFNEKREKYDIDFSKVDYILNMGITLELFATFSANLVELYHAGFINEREDLVPNMSLADLEIIFEFLETASEKLHYFARRDQFEKNAQYLGDEIDLLVFYLQTGFNIGENEFNQQPIYFYGSSEILNNYLVFKDNIELRPIKLRPRRTKWWNDIITKLEQRKPIGWTKIAYKFLNVSYEDQIIFEEEFIKVKDNVIKNWRQEGHINATILLNGPEQRRDLIIGYAYKNIDRSERNSMMEDLASHCMAENGIDNALIIGVDVKQKHYPYSTLAVFRDD